jgi:hypothetical protein
MNFLDTAKAQHTLRDDQLTAVVGLRPRSRSTARSGRSTRSVSSSRSRTRRRRPRRSGTCGTNPRRASLPSPEWRTTRCSAVERSSRSATSP